MVTKQSEEKVSVFCIYCGKSVAVCGCPEKMVPGDKPPLRLHCSECGKPRSDCLCSPLWGDDESRAARKEELLAIQSEVEGCALGDALKVEEKRNRREKIRLSLPESFVLHARGLVGDKRLDQSNSVNEVIGELLESYPTGYDIEDSFPSVGARVRVSANFKVVCLRNAKQAALRSSVSLNAFLSDHLGRCFIALDRHDNDEKDAGYFSL